MSKPVEKTIELFNPSEQPFGKLSNNSYHPMTIDGKKYDTVTNYIYSNMLITPMYRTVIQNTKIKAVGGVNKELMDAIDYLKGGKSEDTNVDLTQSKSSVSREKMIETLSSFDALKNMNDDRKVAYLKSLKTMSDSNVWRQYQLFKVRNRTRTKRGDKQPAVDIKESWVDYAKTGKIKKQEDDYEKRQKLQGMIQSITKKPFEQVNLDELKKQIISQSARKQMGIYQLYSKYEQDELYQAIHSSLKKGYEVLFSNPDLEAVLVGTGNFPIQYESPDPYLGIGADGKGSNLVGKVIMQIRHNLRLKLGSKQRDVEEQEKYRRIYNTYLAYLFLRSKMVDDKSTIIEYINLTPTQIIDKYGSSNYVKGVPDQDTVIKLYSLDKLNPVVMKEIEQPGTMAINLRKNGMRMLRDQLLRDKDDIIFNSYLEYVVRRNYENLSEEQVENAIKQQKSNIAGDLLEKLKGRVIDLFKLGMLSASLSDKIDSDIKSLEIPSEEDVEEAEIASIPLQNTVTDTIDVKDDSSGNSVSSGNSDGSPVTKMMKKIFKEDNFKKEKLINMIVSVKGGDPEYYKDWSKKDLQDRYESLKSENWGVEEVKVEKRNGVYIQPSGNPIGIFVNDEQNHPELRPFNPDFYNGLISIDSMYYPTIKHFMIAGLIRTTGTTPVMDVFGSVTYKKGTGQQDAHKMLLKNADDPTNKLESYLSIQEAGSVYDRLKVESDNMLLSLSTVVGLNKKFEDHDLQKLLLLTGDSTIKWNSPQNYYLGAGTVNQPGVNYVGVTMMNIRSKLQESDVDEASVGVEIDDIIKFIKRDSFVSDWVKMRVSDMCGIVYKFQEYLKIKDGIVIDLNEVEIFTQLVQFVIDVIYQPCKSLVELSKDNNTPVPRFFLDIVAKCKGMSSGVPPVYQPMPDTGNVGVSRYNKEIERKRSEIWKAQGNLFTEYFGGHIEHTLQESDKFNRKQRNDWRNFVDELNESELNMAEKAKQRVDFKEQQDIEYNTFWGIDRATKTSDDYSRYLHKRKELDQELSRYMNKAKNVENTYINSTKDIAQIYWNRISVLLSVLITSVNPATDGTIRNVLVKAGELIAEKSNCIRIIQNEQDNCIVSALINLLIGIKKFKEKYSGNPTLDEDDVKLSAAIILNTSFKPDIVNPNDTDSDEEKDSDEENNDFSVGDYGHFPDDDSVGGGSDYDNEYGDNGDFDGDYDRGGDSDSAGSTFGFNRKGRKNRRRIVKTKSISIVQGNLAKIEKHIAEFNPDNAEEIAQYVLKTVQEIKSSKISSNIKQNRINYFATLR